MENLGWGLQMTVLGMGLVFSLLALMWGLLTLVLHFDKAPAVDISAREATVKAEQIAAIADDAVGAQVPERATVNGMQADLVAAICTAAMLHRNLMWRQAAPHMRAHLPGSHLFASRWVAAGRGRQNNNWQPRGK